MKLKFLVVSSLIAVSTLGANEGFNSEFSHFVGGAVMAGGITAVVDRYYPEYRSDRGMIGFEVSSIAIVAEQGIEYAMHGNARGQLLDAASHIAGSALGAYVTDQYILSPVVQNSASEGKYIGLNLQHTF
ncbi:MAG: hypothetical protein PHU29_10200 [Sulfuricurvum sp.]|uniref:hypothetical protein n=1 Tax=Sulfuricurvum sp. TaxID=2025608 RepID=UPI0026171579|nr:hypothetical protein [Sulfuricurvum sp.]MDD2951148.1 hypothetical protein [Sulfuricurvum sp.]MDD5118911.1 hypothetical protein [Sulfuricurvum sp.]